MNIQWKDIAGYKGVYQVSNTGVVKSVDRYVLHNGNLNPTFYKGLVRVTTIDHGGYVRVGLYCKSKIVNKPVHTLVAEAFICERPDGFQVNHKDGNKLNNKVSNLEWVTPKQNIHHGLRTELIKRVGTENGNSVYTDKDIRFALGLVDAGCTITEASEISGVNRSTVGHASAGHNWKHLGLR